MHLDVITCIFFEGYLCISLQLLSIGRQVILGLEGSKETGFPALKINH